MKKFLPSLLIVFLALSFQQASSQILYTQTNSTGPVNTVQHYNPGVGLAGTPKIVFDDVNIPNALIPSIPGSNYMSLTKLRIGLITKPSSPSLNVKVWATTLDPLSVGRDSLPAIPAVLLGTLNVLPNIDPVNPQRVILDLGDSINPIFNFHNDPSNVYPGYTTIYIGLSFPDNLGVAGWELTNGPDMNVDTMYLYNEDDLTNPRYYSYFGTSAGVHPIASFNIEAFGKPTYLTPVILSNFDVQTVNNENVLNWSTSQEIISNYFSVEHSTDGTNFEAIGQVAAAGNSSLARLYTYTDLNPVAGINYYRLKMVDLDNSMKYSEIKSVRNAVSNVSFSAYPNPALETLYLKILSEKSDRALLSVTNISGQIVIKEEVNVTTGNNTVPVKVNNLSAGTYIIKVQLGNKNFTQKFNKQ